MPLRAPRTGLLLAATLVVVAVAYSAAPGGGFVWDDHHLIEDQPGVREVQSPAVYLGWQFWNQPEQLSADRYYRPLVILSYALDWQLWGGRAFGFHTTNLLLHLVCVGLLFWLARRHGAPPAAAALAAALFGTLPRLTESVAWIAGRTDPLATVFVLGALLVHRSELRANGARVAAAGLVLLALLAKEVAIAGAVVIVVHEALRARSDAGFDTTRFARHLAPLAIALVVYGSLRASALGAGDSVPSSLGTFERAAFGLQALGTYVSMLLDPLRPRLRIGMLGVYEPLRLALGGLGLAALCVGLFRLRGAPRVALVLAFAALVPALHLTPLPTTVVAADRLLYLPVAGLALCAATLGGRLRGDAARVALAAGAVATLVFAISTHLRTRDWADEIGLLELAAARAPEGDGAPHASLGTSHLRARRFEVARAHFNESHRIERAFADVHAGFVPNYAVLGSIAICDAQLGRYDLAAEGFEELVRVEPHVPLHHYNLAVTYGRTGRLDEARSALEKALALYPAYPEARALYSKIR